jgi:Yip1 domain
MAIVDRVKNICLTPNTEWPIIADEPTTSADLITGYVVPLAAIGAAAGFIGGSVIGRTLPFIGTYRVSLVAGLVGAVFSFVMAIVTVFVVSLIIDALAPSFGGEKNSIRALKVAVYSYTPAWVAGVLNILPLLGVLVVLAALYGLYLLYLGLPRLMKCPPDKAIGYTVVVVICAIVINLVIVAVGGAIAGAGLIGAGALGGLTSGVGGVGGLGGVTRGSGPASEVQYSKDSALGKLQELGKKMEESNKKMEAAQKRGDQSAAAAAAVEGLGTLLGGGRRVDPIGIDQLKPFVPENFAGLPKTGSSAEKNGIAGLMVSKAQASYSDGAQKHVTLELSDTGGASGLMGLAGWIGVQGEKEDDNGSEKTEKVDGRLVHEKVSKRGGTNEFAVVLGDRFVVSATGRGVELGELKAAVGGLDLGKLESMKDVGVQK